MSGLVVGIVAVVALAAGAVAGFLMRHASGRKETEQAAAEAKRILERAEREAKNLQREAELHIKAERLQSREEFEKSIETRRKEAEQLEERLTQRELSLERKLALVEKKEQSVDGKLAEIESRTAALTERKAELDGLIETENRRLQQLAGMSAEDARQQVLQRVEKEIQGEIGVLIRRQSEKAKETAEREAIRICAMAIQRYAGSHTGSMMTSSVALPNDEMKGRVIGREGRNIRALEAETGVNFLVDDTPEAVVITGFDPVRREVARQALELLVADGRIHPARIEEVVKQVMESMEETIRKAGEDAVYRVGIRDVNPDLVRKLGRLRFRSSYSQNVLDHSVEVAHLMGVMAAEMGLDPQIAKRIGLLHDIGKALDHEVEGGHAVIGGDFLKRMGETAEVVNAVAAHHEDVEAQSPYALLASAADAISGARPGARSETSEIYVKRLEKLEAIASGFQGVKKCYAIQAGREVRAFVEPTSVDENAAVALARNISKQIEKDMQYPGEIRVVVIRETRCVEYAR